MGRTRYRAGHNGGLRLHFLVYAAGRRRHPPLPPRRGRSRTGAGCPAPGAGSRHPPSRRHARRRPAPQGAVHPFGGQCLRRQRPSRARQLGPAPARHGRSHCPDTLGRAGKRGNTLRCDWSGNGCNGSFRRSGCRDGGTQCRSRCGPCGWPFRRNKNSGRYRNGGRNRRRYCRGNGGKRHHPAQQGGPLRSPAPRHPAGRTPAFPAAFLRKNGPGTARCPGNAPGCGGVPRRGGTQG